MKNIRILMSYDGSNYYGFQTQKKFRTIQETIEIGLSKLTKEKVIIYGCGRTDKGVHAIKYYFNFYTDSIIPAERFPFAMRQYLPNDIVFLKGEEIYYDFHSRFSTKQKTYLYKISNSKLPDPLKRLYSFHLSKLLDVDKMKEATKEIVGTKDFKAFMATGGLVRTTVRTVYEVKIEKINDDINIYVTADGFLYNMVRIIVGTLIMVGVGRMSCMDVKNALEQKRRTEMGDTVPACGLYMYDVEY